MKALVLGGPGFIGTATCKELMRRGVETIAASRTAHPYGTFTSHLAFDRTDEAELARVLAEVEPDVLIDHAAFVPSSVEAVMRNFKGRRYVLSSCADLGWESLPESAVFPWTVVRLPLVIGAGDPDGRIIQLLTQLELGNRIEVPAEAYRQPVGLAWVRDAGYACALAADLRKPAPEKVYEVGFENVTLEDLLESLGSVIGKRPVVDLVASAEPWPEAVDLAAARTDLGFEPSALEDCLAEVMGYFRANPRFAQAT